MAQHIPENNQEQRLRPCCDMATTICSLRLSLALDPDCCPLTLSHRRLLCRYKFSNRSSTLIFDVRPRALFLHSLVTSSGLLQNWSALDELRIETEGNHLWFVIPEALNRLLSQKT